MPFWGHGINVLYIFAMSVIMVRLITYFTCPHLPTRTVMTYLIIDNLAMHSTTVSGPILTQLTSTPFSSKTGPKLQGRWGRRLFGGMASV